MSRRPAGSTSGIDPTRRRQAAAGAASELGKNLERDRQGRLRVKPARSVKLTGDPNVDLPALVQALRDAGLIER